LVYPVLPLHEHSTRGKERKKREKERKEVDKEKERKKEAKKGRGQEEEMILFVCGS
jgi:hypothetical protein